jgi:hypothetical protein
MSEGIELDRDKMEVLCDPNFGWNEGFDGSGVAACDVPATCFPPAAAPAGEAIRQALRLVTEALNMLSAVIGLANRNTQQAFENYKMMEAGSVGGLNTVPATVPAGQDPHNWFAQHGNQATIGPEIFVGTVRDLASLNLKAGDSVTVPGLGQILQVGNDRRLYANGVPVELAPTQQVRVYRAMALGTQNSGGPWLR